MEIRQGGADDAPVMLAMLDGAVAWLASRGRTGQWGATPWSTDPARAGRVRDIARTDDVRIAYAGGRPAGAMALSAGPPRYIEPVDEPEVYVTLLVTDRAHAGRGVGSALLRHAREEALRRGAALLRVDCYAGDDGRLVEYYTANGFARDRTFSVDGWPGQLLTRRL
ncbi:GNAT family N-acetyltransferase [Actinomadura sp. 21ATH]|uniref:GNAT family N-acetyltransferase n=1 Tax=Actinomadura sp. 21ATH TaxID=1735444 RepID=UPI0035BF6F49